MCFRVAHNTCTTTTRYLFNPSFSCHFSTIILYNICFSILENHLYKTFFGMNIDLIANALFFFGKIWEDILGFENAEFYIKRWPQLDGLRFENVLISFPDAIPCGIKVAADGGKINLNPDDKYVIKEGDEVLVIAEDDDTYAPSAIPEVIDLFSM